VNYLAFKTAPMQCSETPEEKRGKSGLLEKLKKGGKKKAVPAKKKRKGGAGWCGRCAQGGGEALRRGGSRGEIGGL